METKHNPQLTGTEISNLWSLYMSDSLSVCVIQHALKHVEDPDIRSIFEFGLSLAQNHIQRIKQFFDDEQYPVPNGFGAADVNLTAPRLFSDTFWLKYIHEMTVVGLFGYGASLSTSARQDVRNFYVECNTRAMELYNKSIDVLLSKGLYHRPPYIPKSQNVDFVKEQHYLAGWFGRQRPLNAIEMTSITFNIKKSIITKALLMGFAQSAESSKVRAMFMKITDLKEKHIKEWSTVLMDADLPVPPTWDSEVTDSTTPPFSDKLMMFHAGFLFTAAVSYYGAGLASAMRRDFTLHYVRTIAEDFDVQGDWVKLMIHNGWMEQPPQTVDREELART